MTRSGCGHARSAAAPVTVPHTRERQDALTPATTHGKKFFVTGGKHITLDNMFKSAEIVSQNAEAVEREKDRKRRLEYHARHEAALPMVWCKRGWDKNALNVTFEDVFPIGHKHATLHLSDA